MSTHVWNFSSVGGVKRVNLESGQDLMHLDELDQKLWTALSCPTQGLEIDHRTLDLIDKDKDGQIRVPEILEAVKWLCSVIKNPDDILKQEQRLPLSAINTSHEAGKQLHNSAKIILRNLGMESADSLGVDETSDIHKIFAGTPFNGDGIVTTDSTGDAVLIKLMEDIMACVGSVADRSGKTGISKSQLVDFYKHIDAYTKWHNKSTSDSSILVFGEQTESAYGVFNRLKSKIDDYFIRCRLAAFDKNSTQVLNLQVARVESISAKDLSLCHDEIASYPLAHIEAGQALPLKNGINPAWIKAMQELNTLVIQPLFAGTDTLNEEQWEQLSARFAAYNAWKLSKKGDAVEKLGAVRVLEIAAGKGKEELLALIEKDLSLATESNNIILVDQLVRYYRDLFRLLKNFVTFYDFYSPGSNAIFLAGTLYIDQRSCDLCIKVQDMDKHNTMVSHSGMYLLYCDCVSRNGGEKMSVVVALTNGDVDNLMVGRNALFYDNSGMDWDATVTKIVENPISIRQAFWSPYRKISRFIESQIEKVASARDKENTDKAMAQIEDASTKINAAPKPPPQPFDIGKFVGIFAAISLAFGAIGSIIASFVAGFLGLVWWQMPLAFLGIILAISGPSMIIAWLKLRKRNLAPILDANGWAINARAIVNIPFGNTLTHLVALPKGAKVNLNDPFTKKKRPFLGTIIILSIVAGVVLYLLWRNGLITIHF